MTRPPAAALRRIVQMHSEPVTIERRDTSTTSSYGNDITYTTLPNDRSLYIDGVNESEQPTAAGEFQAMNVIAYSVPSEDIQVNDRFAHGSRTLEVVAKFGVPDDTDPIVYRYELDRP